MEFLVNDESCSMSGYDEEKREARLVCPYGGENSLEIINLEIFDKGSRISGDSYSVDFEKPQVDYYSPTQLKVKFNEEIFCLEESDIVVQGNYGYRVSKVGDFDFNILLEEPLDTQAGDDFIISILGIQFSYKVSPLFSKVKLFLKIEYQSVKTAKHRNLLFKRNATIYNCNTLSQAAIHNGYSCRHYL
jgi:hypothetical protein